MNDKIRCKQMPAEIPDCELTSGQFKDVDGDILFCPTTGTIWLMHQWEFDAYLQNNDEGFVRSVCEACGVEVNPDVLNANKGICELCCEAED